MDSRFVVRVFLSSGIWLPIFEGSNVLKNEGDGFWPIAVLDANVHVAQPQMRYLLCRGRTYPKAGAKGLSPITMPWQVPLCPKVRRMHIIIIIM